MPCLLADFQLAAGSDSTTDFYPARLNDGLQGVLPHSAESTRRWIAISLGSEMASKLAASLGATTDFKPHGWLGRPTRLGRPDDSDRQTSRLPAAPLGWLPRPGRRRRGGLTCGPAVSLLQVARPASAAQLSGDGRTDGPPDLLLLSQCSAAAAWTHEVDVQTQTCCCFPRQAPAVRTDGRTIRHAATAGPCGPDGATTDKGL
jgi:hypothetical protein